MDIAVDQELKDICGKILAEQKDEDAWAAIESDDMFQTKNFRGGFDAAEMAFCFSYYDPARQEFWFQVTLPEVAEIASGKKISVEGNPAER